MFLPSSSASLVKIYGVAVSIRTIPFMDLLSRFFFKHKKKIDVGHFAKLMYLGHAQQMHKSTT